MGQTDGRTDRRTDGVKQLRCSGGMINLIGIESARWLLSFGVRKIPRTLITPMGMPIMPSWANDHGVAHVQPETVPMNLIWSESAPWLLSFGVRKIPGAFITHALGHVHYAPMGK